MNSEMAYSLLLFLEVHPLSFLEVVEATMKSVCLKAIIIVANFNFSSNYCTNLFPCLSDSCEL